MNLKLIFITFVLQYIIVFGRHYAAAQCPLNELYYDSNLSPICDVNCQDLQRQCPLSSIRPVAGCYCQPNYARNLQQQCIEQKDCANDCFPNETPIVRQAKACENVCRISPKGYRLNICYSSLQKRCVCATGYCRNRNGQCVKNDT